MDIEMTQKKSDFYFCKKDINSKLSLFDNCSSINPKIKYYQNQV